MAAPLDAIDLWFGASGLVMPGPALRRFEDELRSALDVRHVFPLSSGTAALTIALRALASTSDRTDVILPAYTCFTVPAAVVRAGLRPVLCDIGDDTFDYDYARLARVINRRTLAVIVQHLFGVPSDVARAQRLCASVGALVIEDAAQAMGIEADGRMLGTLGDVGIFSLGRGKHVTCGEGGVIATNDAGIAAAIERQYRGVPRASLRDTVIGLAKTAVMCAFIRPSLYWIPASLPFLELGKTIYPRRIAIRRLSGMHAGLMHRMRARLERAQRVRRRVAAELTWRLGFAAREDHDRVPYLRLPMYAATPEDATRLCARARQRGLGVARGYPSAVSEIPALRERFRGQRFSRATRVADHLLTLPTHHWLGAADVQAIVDHVRGVVDQSCSPDIAAVFEREGA